MQNRVLSYDSSADQQILRWPTPSSRRWTLSLLESAKFDPNIVAIVAAGSAVRPNVPSADLDLILVCKDLTNFRRKPPIEIDLRMYAESQIQKSLQDGHDLLNWTIRFGKVLFERAHYWRNLVDHWLEHLPLPSANIARQRAANTARHLLNVIGSGDIDAAREQALSYMTHLARAELLERGIYPTSRPELPEQLKLIGSWKTAEILDRLLASDSLSNADITALVAQITAQF